MASAKRYIVFSGWCYYPAGGADDMDGSFDDLEEAKDKARTCEGDWAQVYDTVTETIVHRGESD